MSAGGTGQPSVGPGTVPQEARRIIRRFLSEDEEAAWHGLLETRDALIRTLDERLRAEHQIPLATVEALMHIAHAAEGTIAVSELARLMNLSPSHVSRVVIDLERKGLVERRRSPEDSRSTRAAATDAGRRQLLEATPTYSSTIHELMFEGLNEREVKQLVRIWERIRARRESGADGRGRT
jgi:DNA-binding MarR family transcriptional regulator